MVRMCMSSDRSVSRNFLALVSGEAFSRVIAFVAVIYIARVLGADGYGVIAFAVGINLYLSKIADFAIEWVGSREIARNPGELSRLASAITTARLVLALVLAGFSILLVQLLVHEPDRSIMSLYFLTVIPIAASTRWIHIGLEDTRPVALARVLGESLGLAIVLIVMHETAALWVPPVAQIASESLIALLLIIILRKKGHKFGLSWNMDIALPVFRAGLPLLAHMLLGLVIYNSDLIFLRVFRDTEVVGYYAAAYTLISLLSNLGMSYGMSLLPAMARQGHGTDSERDLYHTGLAQVFAVCLPITIGGCLLAGPIIGLAFGSGYSDSVSALQLLIWAIPLSILRNVPWAALISRGRQDLLLKAIIIAVFVNILLNFILIPSFGMNGAALATIVTEGVVSIVMLRYAIGQGLSFVSMRRLWRPVVASVLMGVVVALTVDDSLVSGLAVGVLVYIFVLTLLGGIRFVKGQLPALNV